jgi:hypothetical protein
MSQSCLEEHVIEGENPVNETFFLRRLSRLFLESGCLGLQPKVRGKSHVTLNIDEKPIANK